MANPYRSLSLFLIVLSLGIMLLLTGCTSSYQAPAPQPPPPAVIVAPPAPAPAPQPAPAPAPLPPPAPKSSVKTVVISVFGFSPDPMVIKQGDTVVWLNNDSNKEHWPASAAHPTHTVYPEPGGCLGSKFDACQGIAFGKQWNFTFTHVGTWSYHDHLKPTMRGKIVVE